MAITILQRPPEITPAYNDVAVVIESTNYASDNFQYIGEVKDGSTVISKLRTKVYYNSTDKGVFNLKRILETQVSHDTTFDDNSPGVLSTQNSIFNYTFAIGEEYGDPVTETLNVTSFSGWVFNSSYERRDFPTFTSGEVLQTYPVTGARFLTDQTKVIKPDQNDWLYYIYKYVSSHYPRLARYKSYSQTGTLLKTVDLELATLISNVYYIAKIPIGRNLSDTAFFNVLSGSLPVVDPLAYYFTVQIFEFGGTAMSELKTVTLDNECQLNDSYILHYLNKYGGFDSFAFDLASKSLFTTEKKTYKRNNYELTGDSYGFNIDKHAVRVFDSREQKRMTLNSNWITDTQAIDLRQLFSSPVVFMNPAGSTEYIPINVSTPEWETKERVNEPLFNCRVEISIADNYRLQSE